MKSPKEEIVEAKILKTVDEIVSKHIQGDTLPRQLIDMLLSNAELKSIQDYLAKK